MYVKSIDLQNFRNYAQLSLTFDAGTNIFYGGNAQGKTNLLEAIYVGGTSRSHKGAKDRDIIRFGEEESHIRMQVERRGQTHRIDVHLKKQKAKGIAINGVPIRKASELFDIIQIVFFSPEDLQMIKSGPAERRKYMDILLCATDALYLADYTRYYRCLHQRNHLLHEATFRADVADTLASWDAQLIEYGRRLIQKRCDFIVRLEAVAKEVHLALTGGAETLALVYEPSVSAADFAEALTAGRARDLKMKNTGCGPHRDDLQICANGTDLRPFGSQGQQRTAALSLKLAEIKLVEERCGEKPILLLDDVLSELDRTRQTDLLSYLQDTQTLMTCTGLDEFVRNSFAANRTFYVENGGIT